MIADEVTLNRTDEENLVFDLLLRVEAEVHEDLRVVVSHCLLLRGETRCIETIKLYVGVLLQPTKNRFCLDAAGRQLATFGLEPGIFNGFSAENDQLEE